MKTLFNLLMKGLATILPIALTIYCLVWVITAAESMMHRVITLVVPESHYWPGMGIIAGLLLMLLVGSAVNAYIVRRVLALWEEYLERIPVVKTLYGAFRDISRLLPAGRPRRDLQKVVLWEVNGARVLGFVTRDELPEFGVADGHELAALYVPLSYMIGGVTLYVPKHDLRPLDLPVEAAMRLALTGGMSHTDHGTPVPESGGHITPVRTRPG